VAVSQQMIIHFFYGNGNAKYHLGTDFIIHKGIRLAVKRPLV
jgi:hypothetical protein